MLLTVYRLTEIIAPVSYTHLDVYKRQITTLHKTETYLMVGIEDDYDLWMAGNKLDKSAYVSVSLFDNASASDYDNMTAVSYTHLFFMRYFRGLDTC